MKNAESRRMLMAKVAGRTFRFHEDSPEIGWYLYVEEDGRCIHDYLQATLEQIKQCALEEFCVPLLAWKEVRIQ
jgi:uncharacterized protein with HEPN domain